MNFLILIKLSVYRNTVNIILKNQLLTLTMRQEYSYKHTYLEALVNTGRQDEEIKCLRIGKEKNKAFLIPRCCISRKYFKIFKFSN